eukprot:TRINITY_DN8825_c0_g1_i1.p1 TRINITY_DN8825_c0_g1~~TRINITY_DN8825_c0_g1_i1.p1  ORF type:complete len:595 (-),score=96.36 TRINITY_DN8825_c0_g1_i1:84-1868(-)
MEMTARGRQYLHRAMEHAPWRDLTPPLALFGCKYEKAWSGTYLMFAIVSGMWLMVGVPTWWVSTAAKKATKDLLDLTGPKSEASPNTNSDSTSGIRGRTPAPAPPSRSVAVPSFAKKQGLADPKYDMPTVLQVICYTSTILAYMNFTVCMPHSASATSEAGGNLLMSGVVIGAYGIGGIISLPLYVRLATYSYRAGFILQAILMFIGNTWYMVGLVNDWSIWSLTLARGMCGMEAGADFICCVAIATCTPQRFRTRSNAYYNAAISLGLVLGPLIASVSSQFITPVLPMKAETVPILVTIILGLIFFGAVLLVMPDQRRLFEMAGLPEGGKARPEPTSPGDAALANTAVNRQAEKAYYSAAWLALWGHLAVTVIRFTQRVAWEASALWVIAVEYGHGVVFSGYAVSACVWTAGASGITVGWLSLRYNNLLIMKIMDVFEFIGIILMFRIGPPSHVQLFVYVFGSAIFYGANYIQAAPFSSERSRWCISNHWILSLEMGQAIVTVVKFGGMIAGPIISRSVLQVCPQQNSSILFCFLIYALQVPVGSIVMLSLRSTGEAIHGEDSVVGVGKDKKGLKDGLQTHGAEADRTLAIKS